MSLHYKCTIDTYVLSLVFSLWDVVCCTSVEQWSMLRVRRSSYDLRVGRAREKR